MCSLALFVAFSLIVIFYAPLAAADDGSEAGEIWVTQQDLGRISILHGRSALQGGSVETIFLPAGAKPHIITFSPSGQHAYIADLGLGDLIVIRTDDRQILRTLHIGPVGAVGTHQAKPSPDGSLLLVAQINTRTLFKVAADEATESWSEVASLSFASMEKSPICTIFRDDGLRAYVSLLPNGIAIVDVPTMTLLGTLSTDGFVACGMVMSHNGRTVFLASSGGGGHLYRLDIASETLVDRGTLGAPHWHSFRVAPNQRTGFGTPSSSLASLSSEQLLIIDLDTSKATTINLNPTPGLDNDVPDAIQVVGNYVYVSLRASGKLAIVNTARLTVDYVDLAPPSPFAVHGVTVRP